MITSNDIPSTLFSNIYLAEQMDSLHISLATLLDMCHEGEIDLILEQPKKSVAQKVLYLQKVLDQLDSKELNDALAPALEEKNLDFFSKKQLTELLKKIQQQAEAHQVVILKVAIQFKKDDILEMRTFLENALQKPVILSLTVDSRIIGGAIIQYGSYISDYSTKTSLDQFQGQWHKAVVES